MYRPLYLLHQVPQLKNPLDPREPYNFLHYTRYWDEMNGEPAAFVVMVRSAKEDIVRAIKVWQSEVGGICVPEKSIKYHVGKGQVKFKFFHVESPDHIQEAEWRLVDLVDVHDCKTNL